MTNAFLLITTLLAVDIALSVFSIRSKRLDKLVNDVPLVIVEDGKPIADRMRKARVEEGDVLESARELQGLRSMDDIAYAILERNGKITVVPR